MLAGLLLRPGYSLRALQESLRRYRNAGLLRSLPKRIPLARNLHIMQPNVYSLSAKGAAELGLPESEQKALEKRYENLRQSRQSYRLMHDLDISVVHAALLKGQEHGLFRLTQWIQGEETELNADGERRRPDFLYQLNGTYWVAGELDTGEERLESDDRSRRTIEQKVKSYGRMDSCRELDAFRLLFVVSPKTWMDEDSQRAQNVLEICHKHGRLELHRRDFYQVCLLTHFFKALESVDELRSPVIYSPALDRRLSISPPSATLQEPVAARPPLPML